MSPLLPPVKKSSRLNRERNIQIKHRLQAKTALILMWEDNRERELFHWRKCCYGLTTHMLSRNNGLKFKMSSFLTSQDINWRTGVVWIIVMFYQLFVLSFWRHPFTAYTHFVIFFHCLDVVKHLQMWQKTSGSCLHFLLSLAIILTL